MEGQDPTLQMPHSWSAVEDYWPRRLFHIATKTSTERQGPDSYTGPDGRMHVRPRYSILSYTWGRFEIEQGFTLEIKNTSWKIPAIDPGHFTVAAFEKVVGRLAEGGIEWAWIDIACIDQKRDEIKADEIGRQAAIFKNAARAFVWLSRLDTEALGVTVAGIVDTSLEIRDHIDQWDAGSELTVGSLVAGLDAAFEAFFGDMWFSSLWTLQEIVMRKDAVALSKDADPVPWDEKRLSMSFVMFVNHCQNIYHDLEALGNLRRRLHTRRWVDSLAPGPPDQQQQDDETKAHIDNIRRLILAAGFYYLFSENPNVQYGTARYRRTREEEDRIYAIMQIYNLVVGKSARPHEPGPRLRELELEFGAAINARCPIMGQSYVHVLKDIPRNSWCITQLSTVPDQLMSYQDPRPQCNISADPATGIVTATARGRCVPFPDLVRAFFDTRMPNSPYNTLSLFLDYYVSEKIVYRDSRLASLMKEDEVRCSLRLYEIYGKQNLWVLILGHVKGEWSVSKADFERRYIGLLVARDEWHSEEV